MTSKKKILLAIVALVLIWIAFKAYLPIDGVVVDAETGKPIEGAVVLANWNKTSGIGLTATEFYAAYESVTDGNGKFSINGYILNPFVDRPTITIYKAGYVSWNSRSIFPERKRREGFKWEGGLTYSLERFKADYSHDAHEKFIGTYTWVSSDSKIKRAFRWEETEALKERQKYREVIK